MDNILKLRDSLIKNYEQMKNGTMPIKTGKELANTAGKILSSIKLELEYNSLLGYKKQIPYLETQEILTNT